MSMNAIDLLLHTSRLLGLFRTPGPGLGDADCPHIGRRFGGGCAFGIWHNGGGFAVANPGDFWLQLACDTTFDDFDPSKSRSSGGFLGDGADIAAPHRSYNCAGIAPDKTWRLGRLYRRCGRDHWQPGSDVILHRYSARIFRF